MRKATQAAEDRAAAAEADTAALSDVAAVSKRELEEMVPPRSPAATGCLQCRF